MRTITLLLLAVVLSGCTSMRLKYTADVTAPDGKQGKYEYVSSRPLTGSSVWCTLTFWIYGGWCWSYLAWPSSGDRAIFAAGAKKHLEDTKGQFSFFDEQVDRISWDWGEAYGNLKMNEPTPSPNSPN